MSTYTGKIIPTFGGGGAVVPLTLTQVSPLGGLLERSTPVVFEIDFGATASLLACCVSVFFDSFGTSEVVYADGVFSGAYDSGSSIANDVGTRTFTVLRNGGWPASPRIVVTAANSTGGAL